ncbi:MAG: TonB-dependent receptor, partial [Sphingomonadaceae bacterium]
MGVSLRAQAAVCAVAVAMLVAPDAVVAQAVGIVTGRVTDADGAALPGADILVRETGQRTRSDRQGAFRLSGLPAGPVTLEIGYLGFAEATREVRVDPAAPATVTVALDTTLEGGVILVRGTILDSTARALNQQRTADNTTNVISSDAIGRFPDINIAEALQRVPGIGIERDQGEGNFISIRGAPSEFTAVSIDGTIVPSSSPDTRALDLGTFLSDVVAQVEVNKTLLPNQDADSIAGSVNLVTRSPFDNPRLRVTGSGGISYNSLGGTNDKRAQAVVSNVFGNVGLLLSGSWSQTDREVDNVETVWEPVIRPEGDEILAVVGNDFKDYDTRRQRIGLTGAFEWQPDNLNKIYVRGNWLRRVDDEFRNQLSIIYDDGILQPGASEARATWNRVRYAKEFRHRVVRDQVLTVTAGGDHKLNDQLVLDYSIAYSRARQDYPFRSQLLFRSNLRPNVTLDYSQSVDFPRITLFETGEHLDLSTYGFRENTYRSQDTDQEEWAIAANVRLPNRELFGRAAEFQFGFKARLRDVTVDEERFRDRRADARPLQPLSALVGTTRSTNFDYDLGFKFDPDLVRAYFREFEPFSRVDATRRIAQSVTADYSADENILAGYGMTRLALDNTNIILGLRVEHTRFDGSAPAFDEATETAVAQDVSRRHTHFFPNLTIRHEFDRSLIGRAAITRAIARPNYRDIVPRLVENSDTALNIVFVSRGNPDLRPTLATNFDLGLEYYFQELGLLSGGFFYKSLKDYEFTVVRSGTFEGLPARITEMGNADSGRIFGFEVAAQAQFSFLPGFLSNFGIFANYTYADARILLPDDVPDRTGFSPLPNQSKHVYNAAIFYEVERFNARLAYTGRSDYIDAFDDDPRLDTFWEGRSQLDATAQLVLTKNVTLFFEAKNLTDSFGVRYDGVRTRPQEVEQFGRFFFFGGR